ncbi:MAG: sensor histidine kinase [Chloroflexota bacterium]
MGIVRFLRAHLDAVVSILLAAAYLAELSLGERSAVGDSFIATVEIDETLAIAASVAFLLSLAVRTRLPLLPLALAYVALVLTGSGQLDAILSLLAGLALASYSVGAWAGGRAGQVGALAVGGLAGVAVVRTSTGAPEPRDIAAVLVLFVGAWLLGLAVRSLRAGRGDRRVIGAVDWEAASGAPDSDGRDDIVREIRDVVERSMSAVITQSRHAQISLDDEPQLARQGLRIIESAGTEALEETQRLTGLLLSPDGTPLPEAQPGLAELDFLTEQISEAGLPVDMRVEGRPVPLTSELDGVAYRVVQEALMSTLEHATSAHASVVIRYEPDELRVEIVDDGIAVEGQTGDEETAGLVAVRHEVAKLGGTLDAGPGDQRGYWVIARLPFEPDWE